MALKAKLLLPACLELPSSPAFPVSIRGDGFLGSGAKDSCCLKSSFIALGTGGRSRSTPLNCVSRPGGVQESGSVPGTGLGSSCMFFWSVAGEVIGSQHRASGSSQPGVDMLAGSTQLTSSTCWRFPFLQNSSKNRLRILSTFLEKE